MTDIFQHPRLKEALSKMADVSKKPYWDRYIVVGNSAHQVVRRATSEEEFRKYAVRS